VRGIENERVDPNLELERSEDDRAGYEPPARYDIQIRFRATPSGLGRSIRQPPPPPEPAFRPGGESGAPRIETNSPPSALTSPQPITP